jgi:hypothetical protein
LLGATLALVGAPAAADTHHATSRRLIPLDAHAHYRSVQLSPAHAVANSMTWDDAVGDSGKSPDVSRIQIDNRESGRLTFTINLANRGDLAGLDLINMRVDTDLATEGPSPTGERGIDRIFVAGATGWGILNWNGSEFVPDAIPPSASVTLYNGLLTFSIDVNDFDNPKVIGFVVVTSSDAAGTIDEVAPDSILPNSLTVYELNPSETGGAAKLIGTLTLGRARSGTLFTVKLEYERSDAAAPTSGPLIGRTITCIAAIGGKPLHANVKGSAGPSAIHCSWRLPKTSRGKLVKGRVGVIFSSAPWAVLKVAFSKKIG